MKKQWIPLLIVFAVVTLVAFAAKSWLEAKGVDVWVLLGGNVLLFGASLLAMAWYSAAMHSAGSYKFVRQVYSGFMVKFFVLVVGAILYFYFSDEVNKPAIFICMALYLIYNFLGTSQVVKKKTHHK